MSFSGMAETLIEMGYRRIPRVTVRDVKPVPPTPEKYVEICALVLHAISQKKRVQRHEIVVDCTHHEFKHATDLLGDKIRFIGHGSTGYWELR